MRLSTRMSAAAAGACLVATTLFSASIAQAAEDRPDQANGTFRFGIVTDAQYCDCPTPTGSTRYYRDAPTKLTDAVNTLNSTDVEFNIQLGDIIDRDITSFDAMVPIWDKVGAPRYSALGNHDYPVNDSKTIERILGMQSNYYDFTDNGWRFVVLDTNEISLYGNAPGTQDYAAAEAKLAELKAAGAPNAQTWNGGVGATQLAWLDRVLADAADKDQRVIVFSHHPLFGTNAHNAWDAPQVQAALERYGNVVAAFNGHDHKGRYEVHNGIHYVNLKGMVEQPYPTNAYAVVTVQTSKLRVDGYGLEPDRTLKLPVGVR